MRDAYGNKIEIGDFVMLITNLNDLEPCEYEIVSLEPLTLKLAMWPRSSSMLWKTGPSEIVLSQFFV